MDTPPSWLRHMRQAMENPAPPTTWLDAETLYEATTDPTDLDGWPMRLEPQWTDTPPAHRYFT